MDSLVVGIGSAAWLGQLTSISPCPLATNIAAISFVGRDASRLSIVLLSGLMYTLTGMECRLRLGTGLAILLIGIVLTLQHVVRVEV